MKTILLLLLLLPLSGGLILAVAGRYLPRRWAEWIACGSVLGSLLMAILAFGTAGEKRYLLTLFEWIRVNDFLESRLGKSGRTAQMAPALFHAGEKPYKSGPKRGLVPPISKRRSIMAQQIQYLFQHLRLVDVLSIVFMDFFYWPSLHLFTQIRLKSLR